MKLRVTVNGVAYDVEVEILEERGQGAVAPRPAMTPAQAPARPPVAPPPAAPAPAAAPVAGGAKALTSPIPGTVLEVLVTPGQAVKTGETVLVVDAMKMNTQIAAQFDGVVKDVLVAAGEAVKMGQALVNFE